ncbi:MAG: sugar phosphate isomerase/epimerase [Clostridia bacterium]|nr:sugar phosphate isomerase/epimerase [Clostridia bacterium]
MANYTLSAFADEYAADLDDQLAMLREQRVGYLELRFLGEKNVADLTVEDADEVKKKLDSAGIRLSAIGSPLGKINLADDFPAHMERAKRLFEVAGRLDARNIRIFSFYLHQGKTAAECREEVLDKLGQLLDAAKKSGVTLCHENEALIYGESPDRCLDLLNAFSGELRAVFDMGNFVLDGHDPQNAYRLLAPYIEYFHIKDALYEGAIVPPGMGNASIREILEEHREASTRDVFVTLEPHLETFDGLNQLVGKTFQNPYRFESKEIAFLTAMKQLKEILS